MQSYGNCQRSESLALSYFHSPFIKGVPQHSGCSVTEKVDVPANHGVMISFRYTQRLFPATCASRRLTVLTGRPGTLNGKSQEKLVLCKEAPVPTPKIFHTDALSFHYVSDSSYNGRHFFVLKAMFSFHHVSAVPEKAPSGLWNCSVVGWPAFKQHIGTCNAVSECHGEEDESSCSHVYQQCARGSVALTGRCYDLVELNTVITWEEAAGECLRREGYLASLNDPDEWNHVIEFFGRMTNNIIYFGLHSSGGNLAKLRPEVEKQFTLESQDQLRLRTVNWAGSSSHVICSKGHTALRFLACDAMSACFAAQTDSTNSYCNTTPLSPYFKCDDEVHRVPYTLMCDHHPDCGDNSDEDFCHFPSCPPNTFRCNNHQCVLSSERCDGHFHCVDGSDEMKCAFIEERDEIIFLIAPKPPVVVNFDDYGSYKVKAIVREKNTDISKSSVCPEAYFRCPGKWTYCLPVFLRCNGVGDCANHEDEYECDSYVCPGFYRCRASTVCIHISHLCDGRFQCPLYDDELLCGIACPRNCTCHGLAFFCSRPFPAADFPKLRFLDGQGSKIKLGHLENNIMLVFLTLAACGLKHLGYVDFPNLRILDLSRNQLRSIEAKEVNIMNKLRILSLAGNPLLSSFIATRKVNQHFPFLKFLDVSDVSLASLNITNFSIFPGLVFLNLSGCGVERIVGEGFKSLKHLKFLDLNKCPMEKFPRDIFEDLRSLKKVWALNYRLCCPLILPSSFPLSNCHSPKDEISSCDALLRSNFYRVVLSVFSVLALLGNFCSFLYRVFVNRAVSNSGFGAFVTHLCVSDFLMGVYLAEIGVADWIYLGTYLWNDTAWKRSAACKLAGFVSLLSSEVSAFIICLITLDRFLILRFPFSRLHFGKRSAHLVCGTSWFIGVVLAGIPLLPMTSHWEYYSQTGICIPLPITRIDFDGQEYSFGVTIIVNFVLFLFIAAGQAFIYWSIQSNSIAATDSTKTSNSLVIARRLITIASSDFLCWFPIGLLGLLASNGVPIPGEINVFAAVLILPVNSAINPFLYTLNMLLESWRQAREMRLKKMIMSATAAMNKNAGNLVGRPENAHYTGREAMELIKAWVTGGLVSMSSLQDFVHEKSMNAS